MVSAVLGLATAPAGAVVVVGGDNGWEVSFDGNVNGFLMYEDGDAYPTAVHHLRYSYQVDPSLEGNSLGGGAGSHIGGQGLNPRVLPPPPPKLNFNFGPLLMTGEMLLGAVLEDAGPLLEDAISFLDDPLPVGHPNYCDPEATGAAACQLTVRATSDFKGGTLGNDTRASRVRTGLLPAFFSFNVRSPEVHGLRGAARISFAPQIQNANTKNQFGAQVDLREVFFNVEGDFGTFSVGRTLSLFQRQNILNDMTLFGVGAQGDASGGGTTLGRIGYGYVYPQFNARISYKTPNVNGFQLEVGMYDPSRICHTPDTPANNGICAKRTRSPRFETEATYADDYGYGSLLGWFGAMWQEAENFDSPNTAFIENSDVTAWGITGGLRISYSSFTLTATGYTGEALGSVLMLDSDSLDRLGNERENHGWYVQGLYSMGSLKLGVSYGENNADRTDADRMIAPNTDLDLQLSNLLDNLDEASCGGGNVQGDSISVSCRDALLALDPAQRIIPLQVPVRIDKLSSLTFGAYYDVTSWFKLIAEYSRVTNDWYDWKGLGQSFEIDGNVFSVGSFLLW